jgi:hypothetical protein
VILPQCPGRHLRLSLPYPMLPKPGHQLGSEHQERRRCAPAAGLCVGTPARHRRLAPDRNRALIPVNDAAGTEESASFEARRW